jgi:serine/threonine protein kinase/Tfp pilus assembly protein PilF
MNPQHWLRVGELFELALECEPAGRGALLAEACGGDPSLRSEVESLLAAHRDGGSFLEGRPGPAPQVLQPGQDLGVYRVIGLIGRGGMGEVYRAYDVSLKREVAIKVLPPPPWTSKEEWTEREGLRSSGDTGRPLSGGAGSEPTGAAAALLELVAEQRTLRRRFESEALLTATVQHAAVVPIYERGQLSDGRPFYAMKLISGHSLRELIDERKTFAERIALLPEVIAVAEALAHAHSRRIVHRDVKPGNVIIGDLGETALIDWGLAKSLTQDATEPRVIGEPAPPDRTALGAVIGTPAYMSPEQAKGLPVDERTDVFSLGATLYHLFAGRAPHLGETASILSDVQQGRCQPLLEQQPEVPVELAAIVNRAMQPEASGRYPTAREMAEDLRRFQTGQLVLSHRYSPRELLLRWAKRHRALLLSGVAFLLLAAVGAAASVRRIVAERDRANREAETARRVSDFMTRMFKVSNPSEARGNNVTAREILEKAAGEIEGGLAQDPEVQARLMDTIVRVYASLGLYSKALALSEKVVELRQKLHGSENPDTLRSMTALANLELLQGQLGAAEKRYREVLEIQRRLLGPEHPDTLVSMHNLAVVAERQGHYATAEKLYRELLPIHRRVLGPEHPQIIRSMFNLATALLDQGQYVEAEKLFGEALEISRRTEGSEAPLTLQILNGLGGNKLLLGQYAEAEAIYRGLLETAPRILGAEHPMRLAAIEGLGAVYFASRRFAEAERLDREVVDLSVRFLGPEDPDTLEVMNQLAQAESARGLHAQAEKLLLETLSIQRRVLGPEHPKSLITMTNLANVQAREGRYKESEKLQMETLAIARRVLGSSNPQVGRALYGLGSVALREGDRKKALDYLRQAIEQGLSPSDLTQMREDSDLQSVRADLGFEAPSR